MVASSIDRLAQLTQGAVFDLTCSQDKPDPALVSELTGIGKHPNLMDMGPGKLPGVAHVNSCGRAMPVLKVMQTSHCKFNCNYCAFRQGSDRPRTSMGSTELASVTVDMTNAGLVEGLFLSSGIGETVRSTMTSMVDTVRILREKYLYTGYIHMKILPGSTIDVIETAGQYADRLSVNMEAPSETALKAIAPNKAIKSSILKQMQIVETLRRLGKIPRRVGQTTQFVVGGSDDPGANDRALVTASEYLYRELEFRRVYFSPFNPIPGTPLEDREPENPKRTFRLYQADRLIALYGFKLDDFIFNESGCLDLDTDPKVAWADAHPELFPIDIARADPTELLRIPGIGPLTAKKILQARVDGKLKSVDEFKKLGRIVSKTFEYILVNGRAVNIRQPGAGKIRDSQLVLPFGL